MMVVLISQQSKLVSLFSPKSNLAVGAFSGASQGLTGMAGPLMVTVLLARNDSTSLVRANIIALAGGITGISALSLWAYGLITLQLLIYSVIASPFMLLGVWTGTLLFRKLSHWNLRWVILMFLAVTALVVLCRSLVTGDLEY